MTTEERKRRRFSSEFRKEQVRLYELGELTIPEICRLHECCYDTVKNWIKKFGTKPYPSSMMVRTGKEVDRLRDLEKENAKLKQIIGEQQVELYYKSKMLDLAKERLGEDFEKK